MSRYLLAVDGMGGEDGFYIIEAPDAEAALEWGARTATAVGRPIEVRPFVASEV